MPGKDWTCPERCAYFAQGGPGRHADGAIPQGPGGVALAWPSVRHL